MYGLSLRESDAEEKVKKGKEGEYMDHIMAHVYFFQTWARTWSMFKAIIGIK